MKLHDALPVTALCLTSREQRFLCGKALPFLLSPCHPRVPISGRLSMVLLCTFLPVQSAEGAGGEGAAQTRSSPATWVEGRTRRQRLWCPRPASIVSPSSNPNGLVTLCSERDLTAQLLRGHYSSLCSPLTLTLGPLLVKQGISTTVV